MGTVKSHKETPLTVECGSGFVHGCQVRASPKQQRSVFRQSISRLSGLPRASRGGEQEVMKEPRGASARLKLYPVLKLGAVLAHAFSLLGPAFIQHFVNSWPVAGSGEKSARGQH